MKQMRAQRKLIKLYTVWNAFKDQIYPKILSKKCATIKKERSNFALQRLAFDAFVQTTVAQKVLIDKMNFIK